MGREEGGRKGGKEEGREGGEKLFSLLRFFADSGLSKDTCLTANTCLTATPVSPIDICWARNSGYVNINFGAHTVGISSRVLVPGYEGVSAGLREG